MPKDQFDTYGYKLRQKANISKSDYDYKWLKILLMKLQYGKIVICAVISLNLKIMSTLYNHKHYYFETLLID